MVDKQCEVATKTEVLHGTTNAAKSAGSLLLFSTVGQVPAAAAAAPSLPPSNVVEAYSQNIKFSLMEGGSLDGSNDNFCNMHFDPELS